MKRLPIVAFGALVVASIAAFFVTQHLKTTTPVIGANITPPEAFSPGPGGCKQTTHTSFYLQHRADDVDVYVVDQTGTIVRTIAVAHHMRKDVRIPDGVFVWNGRDDNGRLVPDGVYRFRVGLRNQGRTIDLPDPILIRTVAPHPLVKGVDNPLLPNGGVSATIHYAGNAGHNATVHLYRTDKDPARPQLVYSFLTSAKGSTASWDGRILRRPAPAGVYLVGLEVTDRVCNTGHFPPLLPPTPGSTPHAGITVRYLAAEPPRDPVAAGSRALVYVDSRQRPYSWALRRVGTARPAATGSANTYKLLVPVPKGGAGLYTLAIRSGPYRTQVPIVARFATQRSGGILVVLPLLSWQGQNPVDDDNDGVPNTLEGGGPIGLDRVLANGLPAGFADEASLLAYLDGAHLAYDLTTDVGLLDRIGPSLAGHSGVVLAGSERWLPTALMTSLRSYVQNGGRVLTLGIDSLRRSVDVQSGQAVNPTTPTPADAFGARPGSPTQTSAETLVIRDDLGIFVTTSGAFPGFKSFVPITPPSAPGAQLSSAGVTSSSPSIVGYRLGRGIVVEVGLPGFGAALPLSIDAQELTRRLWTILGH